jgi:hypothetical protein
MLPDPLRLAIALVPLAAYSLLLALVNARRRPLVTTGGSDLATLGAALSGVILVGPIELFRPEAASADFGGYVWVFLMVFYWLWVWLAVLVARPRLVVYNISAEELRPVLAEAARQVDPQSRWAGDSLSLPTLGVLLHMESFEVMRNASLKSSGGKQNLAGWRKLSSELRNQLATLRVGRNPRFLGFTLLAIGLIVLSVVPMITAPLEVAQAVQEMMSF